MAVTLPNGSTVAIAAGYGASRAFSAVSNANPAVATDTATIFVNGDYLEVTSGWSKLTDRIARVSGQVTNAYNFEGIDTSLTTLFPAGSGAGTVRKITSFTQLAQIMDSSTDGGDQQFETYQFLESDRQRRIPTVKTPAGITFTVADDPTLAGYLLAKAANDDRLPRAVLVTLANGAKLLYNAYISLGTIPDLTVNKVMTVPVTLSLLSDPVRYAT